MTATRLVRVITSLAVALALIGGCSKSDDGKKNAPPEPTQGTQLAAGGLVDVLLPTMAEQPWVEISGLFQNALDNAGFAVQVNDANLSAETQVEQIEQAIDQDAKVIVVAPVDVPPLSEALKKARKADILVLSYLTMMEEVDGVVRYDPVQVGRLQAQSLLAGLRKAHDENGPWTVEMFAGDANDLDAQLYFAGAMEHLEPLINDGTVVVPSGSVSFLDVATAAWDPTVASTRMGSLLSGGAPAPDGILGADDAIAQAVIEACEAADAQAPVVSSFQRNSNDDLTAATLIRDSRQYSTIATFHSGIVGKTMEVLLSLASDDGLKPPDATAAPDDGGVGIYAATPVTIDKDNVDILVAPDGIDRVSDTTPALAPGDVVGVSLASQALESDFRAALEPTGLSAEIADAAGSADDQIKQIESFLAQKAKVIIVDPVDPAGLGDVLKQAKKQGAWVFAFNTEIEGTDAVDALVRFDLVETGRAQGRVLLEGLEAKVGGNDPDNPWTVELFSGDPKDRTAKYFYDGALEILRPKLDDDTIKVPSGVGDFNDISAKDWDAAHARTRMTVLLGNDYNDKGPDAVLAPTDEIARAVIAACEDAGFDAPIVSGLGAQATTLTWIREGRQYATIYAPPADLVAQAVDLVSALLEGPHLPPTETGVNNLVKDVPAYLLPPVVVTQENVDTLFPQ
ncbi:MAG: substrate-binding domain-containing protein [Micrococcales bacterium]|nr:substrate-binding domain-containing protein [Micrococcales bacterium]